MLRAQGGGQPLRMRMMEMMITSRLTMAWMDQGPNQGVIESLIA